MPTRWTMVRIGLLSCLFVVGGCRSSSQSDGGLLVAAVRPVQHEDPVPPPPPPPCKCNSSIPALGTLCISSHVKWNEGYLDRADPLKATKFWRGDINTSDGKKVTLIAGAISALGETDPDRRGLTPPGVVGFQTGLQIEHCDGGMGTAGCQTEVSTLRGGFLHVEVESASRLQGRFGAPWPFIVRTPAVPAGTYSGVLVLLDVPSGMGGGTLKEVVYRPNQDSAQCEMAGEPDASAASVVVVQPNDGPVIHVLSSPMMFESSPFGSAQVPVALGSDDARFLREVCAFAKRVRQEPMPTTPAKTLPCTR